MEHPHQDPPSATTSERDRRREDRRVAGGTARVQVVGAEVSGQLRDRSTGGLFLDLDTDLRFEVEFEDNGRIVRRPARLVRAQRLPGNRSGWAIEFTDQ